MFNGNIFEKFLRLLQPVFNAYQKLNLLSQSGNYIFMIGKARVLKALKAGKDVIFDATNLTPKYRKWCLDTKAEHIAVFVNTPLKECLKRNSERERVVPPEVIERASKRLVPPTTDEGFDSVIIL